MRGSYLPGVCQVLGEAIYINHLIQSSVQHNKRGITSPTLQMRPLDSEAQQLWRVHSTVREEGLRHRLETQSVDLVPPAPLNPASFCMTWVPPHFLQTWWAIWLLSGNSSNFTPSLVLRLQSSSCWAEQVNTLTCTGTASERNSLEMWVHSSSLETIRLNIVTSHLGEISGNPPAREAFVPFRFGVYSHLLGLSYLSGLGSSKAAVRWCSANRLEAWRKRKTQCTHPASCCWSTRVGEGTVSGFCPYSGVCRMVVFRQTMEKLLVSKASGGILRRFRDQNSKD